VPAAQSTGERAAPVAVGFDCDRRKPFITSMPW
jgi:hypothetical protein